MLSIVKNNRNMADKTFLNEQRRRDAAVKKENWVNIEGGKVRRNVPCVGMSVRM